MVAVYDQTRSALAVAALLVAGQVVPALLVPAVVARIEASSRRGALSTLYLFEALITSALAALIASSSLPLALVLVLVALDGVAAVAASALLRAEVAKVAREDLGREHDVAADLDDQTIEAGSSQDLAERNANAALNSAFSVTFVVGPLLSGVIVAALGSPTALLIDAASFLLCGALLVRLNAHAEESLGESVRARLQAAWRHINDTRGLRALLAVDAIAWILFETGMPIQIAYAKTTLDVGDRGFGLLLTAWGVGAVLGSVVFARSPERPLGYLLSFGTLMVGAGYLGFSIAPSLSYAAVVALVGGIGNGMELPSLFSIVQQSTPKNLHGRLMGTVESLSALCPAVGLPLGGALVVLASPRTAFLIVGVGIIASAAALFGIAPLVQAEARTENPGVTGAVAAEPSGEPSAS